ncbi:monothiol glutaredoxin [Nematocida displodere]|uniref:Monothiol glutaredoxin n=1 Tax=Nematocida displodere TaxID=1805483 RepID=A0A177EHR3_9MICR|nr:monothiol glutaredoxin [Nematocida displodere]
MKKELLEALSQRVSLVHKGMDALPEGAEGFFALDLTNRKEVEDIITSHYGIDAFPVILCFGEVMAVTDLERARKKEAEVNCSFLNAAIKLTQTHPRVLFIKGTPEQPLCKFTKELLAMLHAEGLQREDYQYVNILENDTVREGMKEYSEWPTYPQVYVNHEFIGGLDVLKRVNERGTLAEALGLGPRSLQATGPQGRKATGPQ